MTFKIIAGVVALALMFAYLLPVVIKLGEPALAIVVLIGIIMMLVDMWQSLRSKSD